MTRILTIAHTIWLGMLRRKDIYVVFILLGALLVTLVSINAFGLGRAVGYVKDIGLLMAWIFGWILAVNVSARELPEEETRRTIFSLLAKPVRRFDIVAGKWLGAWSLVAMAVLLFYVLVWAVVLGVGASVDPWAMLQGYLLQCAALAVLAGVGTVFSTRMNRDAAATLSFVASAAMFLVVPRIPELAAKETGVRRIGLLVLYHVLPHLEVFDLRKRIVHDYGPAAWPTFALVLVYGALLTGSLVLIAWLAYRGKRFSRSSMSV